MLTSVGRGVWRSPGRWCIAFSIVAIWERTRRSAILLIAGGKVGRWRSWCERAVPQAERLYATYLEERTKAEEEAGD